VRFVVEMTIAFVSKRILPLVIQIASRCLLGCGQPANPVAAGRRQRGLVPRLLGSPVARRICVSSDDLIEAANASICNRGICTLIRRTSWPQLHPPT
jgi:hypothetical protein